MMSTRQNISNFRPLLNATQINAVICQINYVSKNTSAHSFDYVQYSLFSAIGLLPPSTPLSTHLALEWFLQFSFNSKQAHGGLLKGNPP